MSDKFFEQHAEILRVKSAYFERLTREARTDHARESYAESSALCRRAMIDLRRVGTLLDSVVG